MKIVIVFYSRTGNTKKAAEVLKDNFEKMEVDVDLIEIIHEKRPGYFKAGRVGMKQIELPIKNTNFDISKYDRIIVGVPVWGLRPACPLPASLECASRPWPHYRPQSPRVPCRSRS